jgi:hypothetical protein
MIQPGFTVDNPITGSRLVVIESDGETAGKGWLVESHNVPHAGPDVAEHLHLSWTERFEIIAGTAKYSLDRNDWRRPTLQRFKERNWNRSEPRLLVPKDYGWGSTLN